MVGKTGERISKLLSSRGATQKALASAVGIHPNIVSYWCRSVRMPSAEQIASIAKFFGVSTDYLLGLTDAETNDPDVQLICRKTKLTEASINNLLRLMNDEEDDNSGSVNAFLSSSVGVSVLASSVTGLAEECEQARDYLRENSLYNSTMARDYQTGKIIDRMELSFFKADEAFRDAINKAFGYRQLLDELRKV